MHAGGPPQLPDPGVGPVEHRGRLLAERLEPVEQDLVPGADEPPVEEDVRGREDGGAVHVVLNLPVGLVADAYRPHPAIPGE